MGKPARTTGLPYHLIYPLIAVILLSIAAFAGADSVWYVSVNTQSETVSRSLAILSVHDVVAHWDRFGSRRKTSEWTGDAISASQ
jgi:hypothetical protein